jgi:hypothetical protein
MAMRGHFHNGVHQPETVASIGINGQLPPTIAAPAKFVKVDQIRISEYLLHERTIIQ